MADAQADGPTEDANRPRIEIWEPTYRMEPKEGSTFRSFEVDAILKQLLHERVDTFTYNAEKAKEICLSLSSEIKDRVKKLNFERYKVIVQVTIGEVKSQGARVASRCLWDDKTDTWASYSVKTETCFAVAAVFGLYLE